MDAAIVVQALQQAYKELVEIPTEKMTAAQRSHLIQVERHLIKALMNSGRNRFERGAIRAFVTRMMNRENGPSSDFPCV